MSELYPLLLLPEFHERVWGTRDLSLMYPHKAARQGGFDKPIGEVWLTGDECREAEARERAKCITASWEKYIADHKDELTPLPSHAVAVEWSAGECR